MFVQVPRESFISLPVASFFLFIFTIFIFFKHRTWDDDEDGGGDAFFGTGEKRREEEEFFLTGPQPLQQQPQPPKTLPPTGMNPSPMQKRINPRYNNN